MDFYLIKHLNSDFISIRNDFSNKFIIDYIFFKKIPIIPFENGISDIKNQHYLLIQINSIRLFNQLFPKFFSQFSKIISG